LWFYAKTEDARQKFRPRWKFARQGDSKNGTVRFERRGGALFSVMALVVWRWRIYNKVICLSRIRCDGSAGNSALIAGHAEQNTINPLKMPCEFL